MDALQDRRAESRWRSTNPERNPLGPQGRQGDAGGSIEIDQSVLRSSEIAGTRWRAVADSDQIGSSYRRLISFTSDAVGLS